MGCHGASGNPALADYPALAGQTARYLYLQLKDYKEDRRQDPQMSPMAKPLSREDMLDLAAYFAAQKRSSPTEFKSVPASVARGDAKAKETLCTMCHSGGFMGQNEIPRVAGQQYNYVKKQLTDFKAMRRTNDGGNMTSVSKTLSDQDIDDLSQYLAGLR